MLYHYYSRPALCFTTYVQLACTNNPLSSSCLFSHKHINTHFLSPAFKKEYKLYQHYYTDGYYSYYYVKLTIISLLYHSMVEFSILID